MTQLASAAALLLAAVFLWAAPAKLRRPQQTTASFVALGLPAPGALARLVPTAEVGTAVLLLLRPRLGAIAAAVLLVAFTTVLDRALRRSSVDGSTVRCGCFGSGDDAPVTGATIVRNALLLAAAAVALGTTSMRPGLPGVLAVGAAAVTGMVVLALAALRNDVGRLFPSVPTDDLPMALPS